MSSTMLSLHFPLPVPTKETNQAHAAAAAKRKASEAPDAPSPAKKIKASSSPSPSPVKTNPARIEALPEKPAVAEEREGVIEFRVVNNDGAPESSMIMTGLKNIFQKQLPKMPKDYIARLVYDRTHVSMAIVKPTRDHAGRKLDNAGLEVVGGITYRPFVARGFAEIVFCAISSDQQVKGYGAHL
ncbi:MAG: hypothetical protein INR71_14730, partial [Terriglobus roseus]|nr:hypothetical protein [Terriglobus roseus]